MTKAEAENVIGKEPTSCSASEDATLGKSEFCSYGNAFTDKASISVTYNNHCKLSHKNKSTY